MSAPAPDDGSGTPLPGLGERYPSRAILALLVDKWLPVVLYCLSDEEAHRFNALTRAIPDISKKMLATTLRRLERDGLVDRTIHPEVPPRTEYRLTADGRRLRQPIEALCRWAIENHDLLDAIEARRLNP